MKGTPHVNMSPYVVIMLNKIDTAPPKPNRLLDWTLFLRAKLAHVKQVINTNTMGSNGISFMIALVNLGIFAKGEEM